MALSADRTDFVISQDDRGGRITPEVKNASVIYYGALVSCDTDTGAVKPFDGTKTDKLMGWHNGDTVTGDSSATPPPRAQLITGPFMWKDCPVTGLAGTNADIGKEIWATDDGTYTRTDPGGSGARVGLVVMYNTTAKADVWMRSMVGFVDTQSLWPTPTPTPTPT